MKKIFCIFIMFCICIVNAWADVANPCPPDTLKKIGNWIRTCANQTGDAAKKLNKCIEYFNSNCGDLNATNTDTAVASVTEPDCTAFEGKNFKGIEDYLDDQVGAICAAKKVDCPYPRIIALWKLQCAGKDIMTDIENFEKECNKNGDKTSFPYPGDTRTLEMIMEDISKLVEEKCPQMPSVDEGCVDPDAKIFIQMWRKQCEGVAGPNLISLINDYEAACKANFKRWGTGVRPAFEANINGFAKDCGGSPEDKNKKVSGNVDYTKITGYGSALDGIIGNLDLSVWKNADGKFNTARLASDSIAGVVLGTAGGLITSSVMKKHQAADGFEDLKCVVGGQSVAGWGDVFRVGIQ
ncbi:MAG: hypothetical protein R8M71_04350 [Alphaproteobacteria bacterium]|nr:hypothetical protein [Alphaproteobacteria bacterium]